MEINFRDICGNLYTLNLSESAKVSDACKLLSSKTGINESQIFLVSTNEDKFYYQDYENMIDVVKENPESIHFIKHMTNHSLFDNSKQISEQSLKTPHERFYNAIQHIQNWQYTDIHDDYTTVVNSIPDDFQERVNRIAEFGYPIEDIKEALRTTNYDVMVATHLLVLVTGNHFFDESDDYDSDFDGNDDSEIEVEYIKNEDTKQNSNENDEVKQSTNSNNDKNNKDEKQKCNDDEMNDSKQNNSNNKVNELNLQKQNEISTNPKEQEKLESVPSKENVNASSNDDHESF